MSKSKKTLDRLERDVRDTRSELGRTYGSLRDRVAGGPSIEQAVEMLRESGGELADGVVREVRQNPVPAFLVGAGLAWMAVSAWRGGKPDSDEEAEMEEAEDLAADAEAEMASQVQSAARYAHEALNGASDVYERSREAAAEAVHGGRERVAETADQVRERAAELSESARQTARRATDASKKAAKENPLLICAIAVAAGALLGAAMPSTRREKRLFGKASGDARQAVKGAMREGVRKASTVAESAIDEAVHEAGRQGLLPEEQAAKASKPAARRKASRSAKSSTR